MKQVYYKIFNEPLQEMALSITKSIKMVSLIIAHDNIAGTIRVNFQIQLRHNWGIPQPIHTLSLVLLPAVKSNTNSSGANLHNFCNFQNLKILPAGYLK